MNKSDKLSWDELAKRADPKGVVGMTAQKFREMILAMMKRAIKNAHPPKNNN